MVRNAKPRKLSPKDVATIIKLDGTIPRAALVERFGVTDETIRKIISRHRHEADRKLGHLAAAPRDNPFEPNSDAANQWDREHELAR